MAFYSATNASSTDQILAQGKVLERNSTLVPMSAGATFLGPWENVEFYAHWATIINTDQDGTLYLQGSVTGDDNTDTDAAWDTQAEIAVTGNAAGANASIHTLVVLTKFIRLKYVNGGVDQTTFRAQMAVHKYNSMHLTSRLNPSTGPVDTDDVTLHRSAIMGKNPSGDYNNVPLDASNALTVDTAVNTGVDDTNSTTTPLNNGVTFTGTWVLTEKHSKFATIVKTDQTGQLYIDHSSDGTNVDKTDTVAITTAGISNLADVVSKYMRIRIYNDSGSNQTVLRAQSILRT